MNFTVGTRGLPFLELASLQAFHGIVKELSAVRTYFFFRSMLIPTREPDHIIYRFLFPLYPAAFFTHKRTKNGVRSIFLALCFFSKNSTDRSEVHIKIVSHFLLSISIPIYCFVNFFIPFTDILQGVP